MTEPLPADPEGMNDDRALWADAAIRAFMDVCRTEFEDSLGDLLCDLMHWADRAGFQFDLALERARCHYEAETALLPDEAEGSQ